MDPGQQQFYLFARAFQESDSNHGRTTECRAGPLEKSLNKTQRLNKNSKLIVSKRLKSFKQLKEGMLETKVESGTITFHAAIDSCEKGGRRYRPFPLKEQTKKGLDKC